MNRNQAGYAITVLLAVNGVAAVDDGDKFVQLVPVQDWSKMERFSPKPQPGADLLDPKEIPKFNGERPANPVIGRSQYISDSSMIPRRDAQAGGPVGRVLCRTHGSESGEFQELRAAVGAV